VQSSLLFFIQVCSCIGLLIFYSALLAIILYIKKHPAAKSKMLLDIEGNFSALPRLGACLFLLPSELTLCHLPLRGRL
jgi:hypothetical protein